MPTDGVFIHYLTNELKKQLIGGKINKIYQPAPLMIILQIRGFGQNYNLLLSSVIDTPRIHITKEKFDNPQNPLNFCMILRKYIERGEIVDVTQLRNDRLISLHIKSSNELGDEEIYQLIIEVMGRNSNIILINEKMIIIDAIRKVPPSINNTRLIIPKATYLYPESSQMNPFLNDSLIISFSNLEGCSKILINNMIEVCNNDYTRIISFLHQDIHPVLFLSEKTDYYVFDLPLIDGKRIYFDDISSLLDYYYTNCLHIKTETINNIKHVIKAKLKSYHKKEDNILNDLAKAKQNLIYNDYGILLQANLYLVKKGDKNVTVNNFLTDNSPIVIELDPYLEPSINLKRFFTKGKKAKTTLIEGNKQLILVRNEIAYLEEILYQLDNANINEVNQIKEELINNGLLKNSFTKKPSKKSPSNKKVLTKVNILKGIVDDVEIYVGKNNLQNEYLTTIFANIHDYWFHVKNAPGSHVIIHVPNNDPNFVLTENLIRTAANLCAYYSTMQHSSTVPVDYTKVKYIKKIPGMKGYHVTYTNNVTIYIDPVMPNFTLK